MTTVSATRLATVFVDVADSLVDEFDLIDFLHRLTAHVADLFDTAAVGLMLGDQRGRLQFMAASDESGKIMELFQVQLHEGPCLDAFRTAAPVVNVDLPAASDQWPNFAPRAAAAGFRAVHAFPLRLRNQVIGAMSVFSRTTETELDRSDMEIVQSLADVAAIALLQERAIRRGELLSEQLQGALNSRVVIEQAKGIIAQARAITVDEAFALMRDYARRNNRRLGDVAHAVIDDLSTIPDLARPV
jgi:GAF domain-containing protein